MARKATQTKTTTQRRTTKSQDSGVPDAVLKAAQALHKTEDDSEAIAAQEKKVLRQKLPEIEQEPKLWVYDRLAKTSARTHDMRDKNGIVVPVTFKNAETPMQVPYSAGIRLIAVDGFDVFDEDGTLLESTKERTEEITLRSDQTVANYDELQDDALVARVASLNGPKKLLVGDPDRQSLIKYLVSYNQQREDAKERAKASGLNMSLQELLEERGLANLNKIDDKAMKDVFDESQADPESRFQQVMV